MIAALALAILVAGVLSQLELQRGGRPDGGLAELQALRGRGDVNVLFLLIDTLRADRLHAYGYERETGPSLDALADGGVRFAHVQAQSSWTKASMASLWTGLYPVRTGVLRYSHSVSQAASLPAEILREAGYRTGGIWRNGWVAPNFGFHQGFDLYQKPAVNRRPERLERGNPSAPQLVGSDLDITESALEFLRVFGHERWFLYLHYMDVHQYVYDRDSARFGTSYSDIYDNSILWVDRNVGRLLSELVDRDLAGRTIVVVVSDHGEAFFEHGFEGHARDLHREVTGTPFLLSLPFRLDPGVVVEEPVENVDVWPTLLDLLGLPPLPDADGRSLVPLIEAQLLREAPPAGRRPDFAQLDQTWGRVGIDPDPLVAVGRGSYRLMHRPNRPEADQLFDRSEDLMEQNDLAASLPEIAAELRGEAAGYLASPPAPWGAAPEVELDSMELGQLRALGYVIDEGEEEEKTDPDDSEPEADQGS